MKIFNKIYYHKKNLYEIAKKILQVSNKKLCDVNIILSKDIGIKVLTRHGIMNNIEFYDSSNFVITIFLNNRKGIISFNNIELKNICNIIDKVILMTNHLSYDPFVGVPDLDLLAHNYLDLDLFHLWEFNISEAIGLASLAEMTALNFDSRIVSTEGGEFISNVNIKLFANNYDIFNFCISSSYYLSCCVVAKSKNEMERDYFYTVSRKISDLDKPEYIGKNCALRVLKRLNPLKLITGTYPIIFLSDISNHLFKYLVIAISGHNVYRKSTCLYRYLNKEIFPTWLNINERPHILRGLFSSYFDSEGVRTVDHIIVLNGVLKKWLLTSYSGRQLGFKSTGHYDGIHNWFVSHSDISLKSLLCKVDNCILVTELIGQGVNIVTGDYSKGAFGFWVNKGVIEYPINEITISGNLKDMWKNILYLSNDIDKRSNIQCGSILLSDMQVSGL
ncbi:metalloprotease PmbA [Candidatus Purcelliella pentastirinorum]|uniref:metalloprotease PmbA n=1 Tax=Candidatus Purcelliella pentastirinorum TaxID=472834 RepID=UPI002368E291|nr:metalloprotease PmbA [Candidatus Purcelliella pentastirinorum]WDI79147.1 metalloprotease PmbA [Candidatus Purcelliella pentastirinorum]WDR80286.1 metalloprotease PmbA [Candidatus Purcelliella pentastirinorum]